MNKRFVVCIVLSLVMCLAMAFSASAAKITDTSLASKYDPIIDEILKNRPAGYNYQIIYVVKSGIGNSSIASGVDNVQVCFFKDAVTPSGLVPYYLMSYNYTTGTYGNLVDRSNTSIYTFYLNVSDSNIPSIVGTNGGSLYYLSYYIADRSTAKFYNHDTAENGLYKNLNWQLNLGPHWSPVDISALQALINTTKVKTNTGYTGQSWQALQSAITAAENLLKTTGYTQSQVDSVKNTLQAALDGLQLLPDVSGLQALINQAKGIQGESYILDSWQALQSAINAAQVFCNGNDYTAAQVESEISKLQTAIDNLELIPSLPDTTELVELLVEADQIDDIGYTVPTWTRFDNARTAGHTLLAQPVYTVPEVASASMELRVSMTGLALQAIIPPAAPLGFDLGTGDISGFLSPAYPIFSGYITSLYPVLIGLLAIMVSIKILPVVFERIFRGFRR